MNKKFQQKLYHANVNLSLTEENLIQIKSEITTNFDAILKKHLVCENIIFGILLYVVAKTENIWQVLSTIQ